MVWRLTSPALEVDIPLPLPCLVPSQAGISSLVLLIEVLQHHSRGADTQHGHRPIIKNVEYFKLK